MGQEDLIVGHEDNHDAALQALSRIQQFEVDSLPRIQELGQQLSFVEAVKPAGMLVDLFKRLSATALKDFPDQYLDAVTKHSNSAYQLFDQALSFDPTASTPSNTRDGIITQIRDAYGPTFIALHPLIAYSLHRSADFQRLDTEARATLQSVEDRAGAFASEMKAHGDDAARILEEIRNTAAEEGVSQQAAHFRGEAERHDEKADTWRQYVVRLAIGLGVFAVLSIFFHKIPWIVPESNYEWVQLGISKFLIFSVIAYMLFLSSRNFLSHKHNSIVNRHRQNALMTHKALVEAAAESGVREAIMLQAASCIFSPQSTGYAQSSGDDGVSPKSMVEILSKPISEAAK